MPMTIRQIMSKAGPERKRAGASVDITKTAVKKNKQGMPMVVCKTQTKVTTKGKDKPKGSANTYVTTVEVFPKSQVIVSCSCDDFKFTWEAALHDRGAARIEYSNGESPDERNPGRVPGCCIVGTEYVMTGRGLLPIKDVREGDSVQTIGGLQQVDQHVFMGNKKTVKVFTDDGGLLKATPDHRVLTVRNGKVGWLETQHLRDTDYLVKLSGTPAIKESEQASLARVLGYHVAEGSGHFFCAEHPKNVADFQKHWHRAFPDLPCRAGNHGVTVFTAGKRALLAAGYVDGAYNKVVPEWILQGTKEEMRNFVIGAYAGDGWTAQDNVTYGSVSLTLIRQLQLILQCFGLFARITKNISGINSSTMYLLRLSDFTQCQRFIQEFPPVRGVLPAVRYDQSSGTSIKERVPFRGRDLARRQAERIYSDVYEGLNGEPVYIREAMTALGVMTDTLFTSVKAKAASTAFVINPRYSGGRRVAFAKNTELVKLLKEPILNKIMRTSFKGVHTGEWGLTKTKLKRLVAKVPALQESPEVQLAIRDDVCFVKVCSVKIGPVLPVYDIAVDKHPHFIASGFVVHNCKHLYAVGQMLIDKGKL